MEPPAHPAEEGDFKLTITRTDGDRNTFTLNFRPTQSVLNVKLDLSNVTNIPVSRQKWIGWPEGISDELTLAQTGISRKHKFYLSEGPRPNATTSVRDVSLMAELQCTEIRI